MTVIYLDVLLFVNGLVNYFLLSAVCYFTHETRRRPRMALAAAVGSLFSLTLLWQAHGLLLFAVKGLGAAVMCALAFRTLSPRRLLRSSLFLLAATYLFGGALLALGQAARSPAIVVQGHSFYIDTSPAFIILCAAGVHLLLCVAERLFRRPRELGRLHDAVLVSETGTVHLRALLDSGNSLREPLSGRSVIVVALRHAPALLTPVQLSCLHGYRHGGVPPSAGSGFVLIPYAVVGGSGLLPAFPLESCRIVQGARTFVLERPFAAFPPKELTTEADIIVGANALQTEE